MKKTIQDYIAYFIYSEKISPADNRNFFNNLINTRTPFLGLINFSDILSLHKINLLIRCQGNTLKMYVKNKKNLSIQAPLVFPFRLEKPKPLEIESSGIPLSVQFITNGNMFDYLVKENTKEFKIRIFKFLGKFNNEILYFF